MYCIVFSLSVGRVSSHLKRAVQGCSGLSNSLALTSLVHTLATSTLVALASLPPLLYLIPATVLFLDTC
jgi:hypothetical protein